METVKLRELQVKYSFIGADAVETVAISLPTEASEIHH